MNRTMGLFGLLLVLLAATTAAAAEMKSCGPAPRAAITQLPPPFPAGARSPAHLTATSLLLTRAGSGRIRAAMLPSGFQHRWSGTIPPCLGATHTSRVSTLRRRASRSCENRLPRSTRSSRAAERHGAATDSMSFPTPEHRYRSTFLRMQNMSCGAYGAQAASAGPILFLCCSICRSRSRPPEILSACPKTPTGERSGMAQGCMRASGSRRGATSERPVGRHAILSHTQAASAPGRRLARTSGEL